MEKRGLSNIITTVLIILIALVAIALIWYFIRAFLRLQGEENQAKASILTESVDIDSADLSGGSAVLLLSRGAVREYLVSEEKTTEVVSAGADVVSSVDLSASMYNCDITANIGALGCCTQDGDNYDFCDNEPTCKNICGPSGAFWSNKTNLLKFANKNFVGNLFGEGKGDNNLGIVAYADKELSTYRLPLTNSQSTLEQKIDNLKTALDGSQSSTCIWCGLEGSLNMIKESPRFSDGKVKKIIILMTDGEPTINSTGKTGTVSQMKSEIISKATEISDKGIILNVIGFGDLVNEDFLRDVADAGGGNYYSSINVNNLQTAYQQIAEVINREYLPVNDFFIKIVFYNGTTTYVKDVPSNELPQQSHEKKRYTIYLGDNITNVNKIDSISFYTLSTGKNVSGTPSTIYVKK